MKTFTITCPPNGHDVEIFKRVVNQGIDPHLEAFTQSTFYTNPHGRLCMDFAVSEMSILLRRLLELEDEEADAWVRDIVESHYQMEVWP